MTHQEIVTAGGGDYRGMMSDHCIGLDLVLFDAPQTGSTLAIPSNKMSVIAVRLHIDEHVAMWVKKGGKLRLQPLVESDVEEFKRRIR